MNNTDFNAVFGQLSIETNCAAIESKIKYVLSVLVRAPREEIEKGMSVIDKELNDLADKIFEHANPMDLDNFAWVRFDKVEELFRFTEKEVETADRCRRILAA